MEDQTPVTIEAFLGLNAGQAMHNLEVRLYARIASIYFRIRQLRIARIHIERALDARHGTGDRGWKDYNLNIDPQQYAVYAEVLDVSAELNFPGRIMCGRLSTYLKKLPCIQGYRSTKTNGADVRSGRIAQMF